MTNNGVAIENVVGLVNAIEENRDLGKVRFRARSAWQGGTRAEVTVGELLAGGVNIARKDREFKLLVDEPVELGGTDEGPNPIEYLAAGLCGCITAGMATNGAMFETEFEKLEIDVEVLFDVAGFFGLDDSVRNGALELKLDIRAKGSDPEKIQKVKETIDRKSPLKETLAMPLKITTTLEVEQSDGDDGVAAKQRARLIGA